MWRLDVQVVGVQNINKGRYNMKYCKEMHVWKVEPHDVVKVKMEADELMYKGKTRYEAWPIALWKVAKCYAPVGSAAFGQIKRGLARECGHRGGTANAARIRKEQANPKQMNLPGME